MISVFLTSIRPRLWPRLYANICKATTRPFEVIVTGPFTHPEDLPRNFRLVRTDVKPAQALESAARECRGYLIVGTTDDLMYEAGALDLMAEACEKNTKALASARYFVGDRDEFCYHQGGAVGVPGLTPLCPMMQSDIWMAAGGTDPCFCSSYGYDDLVVRLQMAGMETVIVPKRIVELREQSDLWNSSGNVDLQIIRGLWCDGKTFTGKRAKEPGSYTDATLLTENQGEVRGSQETRWR
jgi:hypothetical protein